MPAHSRHPHKANAWENVVGTQLLPGPAPPQGPYPGVGGGLGSMETPFPWGCLALSGDVFVVTTAGGSARGEKYLQRLEMLPDIGPRAGRPHSEAGPVAWQ